MLFTWLGGEDFLVKILIVFQKSVGLDVWLIALCASSKNLDLVTERVFLYVFFASSKLALDCGSHPFLRALLSSSFMLLFACPHSELNHGLEIRRMILVGAGLGTMPSFLAAFQK